jgi:hypothetical protein
MSEISLSAPIIPGESAAGIRLGIIESELHSILGSSFKCERWRDPDYCTNPKDRTKYESPDVVIWLIDGVIYQIGVRNGYRGLLAERFQVGCIATDLAELGEIGEDEIDNLIIKGLPGFCFEVFAPSEGERKDIAKWRVKWFFVFPI